jgi:REP element-mobilizing transposase RayT
MIHGYHVVIATHGFWLPNDPRGSWSETVRKWELLRFGECTRSVDKRALNELSLDEIALRDAVRAALAYPPVTLTGLQAAAVGRGFGQQIAKSDYTIWACSIMPEHSHLVLARHHYKMEQIVNLMKGAATTQLLDEECHPLAGYAQSGRRPPRMWAEHEWTVYLDSEEVIEEAIAYVEENPIKEGKPKQQWDFVTPFTGVETGGWTTYH